MRAVSTSAIRPTSVYERRQLLSLVNRKALVGCLLSTEEDLGGNLSLSRENIWGNLPSTKELWGCLLSMNNKLCSCLLLAEVDLWKKAEWQLRIQYWIGNNFQMRSKKQDKSKPSQWKKLGLAKFKKIHNHIWDNIRSW